MYAKQSSPSMEDGVPIILRAGGRDEALLLLLVTELVGAAYLAVYEWFIYVVGA